MAKDKVKETRDRVAKVAKACSPSKLNASTAKKAATRAKQNRKSLEVCLDAAMKAVK